MASILADRQYTLDQFKYIESLNISNSAASDMGQYACIVSNSKGEVKSAFSLNVH